MVRLGGAAIACQCFHLGPQSWPAWDGAHLPCSILWVLCLHPGWDGEGGACILHIVQPGGTSPLREPRALDGGAAGVAFNQPGNALLQPS